MIAKKLYHFHYQNGNVALAEQVATEGANRHHEGPKAGLVAYSQELGDSRLAQGKCDEALQAYELGAEDSDEYETEAWITLYLAQLRCGKREQARRVGDRVLKASRIPLEGQLIDSRAAVAYLLEPKAALVKTTASARSVAAYAHSCYSEMAFVDKNYEKAHAHALLTIELEGYWDQWPYYCSKYQRVFGKGYVSNATVLKEDQVWAKPWLGEVKDIEKVASLPLQSVVRDLRAYECSDAFINMELENFYKPLDFKRTPKGAIYSPQNYQYGTFFFNGFRTMFEDPLIQPYVAAVRKAGGEYLMLGGNVGNEAFYGALHYGLKTRAVEIMCNLVDKAQATKAALVPTADVEFTCADALAYNVSQARLVYLDNEIWDNFLTTQVYRKLGRELPVGALVIGWKDKVIHPADGWKNLGAVGVETSWSEEKMDVFVLERVAIDLKAAGAIEEEGEDSEEEGEDSEDGEEDL